MVWTQLSLFALQNHQLELSGKNAVKALWVVTPLSQITFHAIPDIEVWSASLEEIHLTGKLQQQAPFFFQQLLSETTSDEKNQNSTVVMKNLLQQLTTTTQKLESSLPHSVIGRKFLLPKIQQKLALLFPPGQLFSPTQPIPLTSLTQNLEEVLDSFSSGSQHILIIFQNSEELRATGGFMGSYALLQLEDGRQQHLEVQDIYEPDGQFTGFVEAPPGLKEYLSSGHGMRLPDANWWPNLPSSAQKILNFFALGKQQQIDHVIFLNLSVAQDVLKITGDVYLPDYQLTVNADNLSTVARSDREQFFPGSQQKRNFLSSLFTQLKLKITDLRADQQLALLQLLGQKLQTKEIQMYTNHQGLQEIWQKYGVAGQVWSSNQPVFSLFAVASNVGINKANKKVHTEASLIKTGQVVMFTLQIENNNTVGELEPPVPPLKVGRPLDYINYQRLLIPTSVEVKAISIDGKSLNHWQEDSISVENGQQVKQIGFLATVPVQEKRHIIVTFVIPAEMAQSPQFVIQKQSGLPPILYHISWENIPADIVVEKDLLLSL